jgi:hypothetical protein
LPVRMGMGPIALSQLLSAARSRKTSRRVGRKSAASAAEGFTPGV